MPAPDLADFLDRYPPPVEEVAVCARPDLVSEFEVAESAMFTAQRSGGLGSTVPQELIDRVADLEAEIEQSVMVFKVQGVSKLEWSDLLAAHPPSDEARKEGMSYDQDGFELAALAKCAVEPTITVETAARLRATVPEGEWSRLALAVFTVNQGATSPPKSLLLSAIRHMSDESSTTPLSEGSLAGPSLDGSGEQSPNTTTTTTDG